MGCLKIFLVKGKKANVGQADKLTDRLTEWFLVLHFAAKKWLKSTAYANRLYAL